MDTSKTKSTLILIIIKKLSNLSTQQNHKQIRFKKI